MSNINAHIHNTSNNHTQTDLNNCNSNITNTNSHTNSNTNTNTNININFNTDTNKSPNSTAQSSIQKASTTNINMERLQDIEKQQQQQSQHDSVSLSISSIVTSTKATPLKDDLTNMHSKIDQQKKSTMKKEYILEKEIGKGSFAVVYRGYSNEDPNFKLAVKSVPKSKLKNKKILENLEIEISILKKLNHKHIVNLIDCQRNKNDFLLIMEYCSLGDLTFLIKKRNELIINHPLLNQIFQKFPSPNPDCNGLNIAFVLNYLQQLASALKFLRSRNLIHRDIKPQNLLLSTPYTDYHDQQTFKKLGYIGISCLPILKIADFGFARFLPNTSLAETLCGSPLYMAPEILNYQKYNAKADLWSVGTVLYEMVYGKPPFKANNHLELLKKIKRTNDNIPFPSYIEIDDDMKFLISRLLKFDPIKRMSFQEFFENNLILKDLSIYEIENSNNDKNNNDDDNSTSNNDYDNNNGDRNDKSKQKLESISKNCVQNNLFISEYLKNKSPSIPKSQPKTNPLTLPNVILSQENNNIHRLDITNSQLNVNSIDQQIHSDNTTTPITPQNNTNNNINNNNNNNNHNNNTTQSEDDKTITPEVLRKNSIINNNTLDGMKYSRKDSKTPSPRSPSSIYITPITDRYLNSPSVRAINDSSDIKGDNDYVVVEKNTVEVNELADQLARINHSPHNRVVYSNPNQQPISVHPHYHDAILHPNFLPHDRQSSNAFHQTSISPLNAQQAPSQLQNQSSSQYGQQLHSLRRNSRASSSSTGSRSRRTSSVDRHVPVTSLNISNALSRALGAATTKLFGGGKEITPIPQTQINTTSVSSPIFEELIGNILLKLDKSYSISQNDSINLLLFKLEDLLAKAFVIYSFAESKFSEILPPHQTSIQSQPFEKKTIINVDSIRHRSSFSEDEKLARGDSSLINNNRLGSSPRPSRQNSLDSTRNIIPSSSETPVTYVERRSSLELSHLCKEAILLYMKSLSFLAKAMQMTSKWWYNSNDKSCSSKINLVVQCVRDKFNECLEKADFLRNEWNTLMSSSKSHKLKSNTNTNAQSTIDPEPVCVENLIYDRALEISKSAAKLEIQAIYLTNCELGYCTSIWLLQSLLDSTTDISSNDSTSYNNNSHPEGYLLDEQDKKIIEKYIASITTRLRALRIKLSNK
ncbi:hypothetical protein TBLA_0D02230 [Henningerozyma blattae CBS 6284]|uniref:Serine/threonine-protein kinase ATG1 n=1 Tax=Henningerozyma blattae (strain ATCC 34711 / CBS 6284 / DSM 70876 / NBRC 10599 / NRRL Y-10934 / UCD 77-7) TaxID=1071380 RepID=I2H2X5_HENB6|nr:hypothetical protein TBLA_0D02230 [Tetrapisispora blattae CBS 6284]CCH60727.1 hypothetical protein TBLA_0D02230 [Tetrapisispora blattae CBS 6284]